MKKPREITVAAGILLRGESVLIDQKSKGPFAGLWEFPGGKIEDGETPFAALERELFEELSIRVTEATLWQTRTHTYPHLAVTLYVFLVNAFTGEAISKEGQCIRWVSLASIEDFPFLAADAPLLPELVALLSNGTKKREHDLPPY